MESVFKGKTAFQSLYILKTLTGCLNLNKYHSLQGYDLAINSPMSETLQLPCALVRWGHYRVDKYCGVWST